MFMDPQLKTAFHWKTEGNGQLFQTCSDIPLPRARVTYISALKITKKILNEL